MRKGRAVTMIRAFGVISFVTIGLNVWMIVSTVTSHYWY